MKALKKTLKILLWTLAGVLALSLLLALLHPLWLGPAARWAANKYVPEFTKTEFSVGRIGLNLYSGRLTVEDCKLSNPSNYAEKTAFELKSLDVSFRTLSVFSDVIRIDKIEVDGAGAACIVEGMERLDPHLNFIDIAKAKEREALAAMTEAERSEYLRKKKEEDKRKKEEEEKLAKEGKQGPGKRVVISEITVKNTYAAIGFDGPLVGRIRLPDMTFRDIGGNPEAEAESKNADSEKEAGLTLKNAWLEIWTQIKEKSPEAAAAWNTIAKPVDWIVNGVGDIASMASELGVKVLDNVGAAGQKLLEGAGDIGSGAKDAAKDALDGGGKLLKSGLDAVGGLL